MTGLQRPVKRETAVLRRERGKLRPLLVELHAGYLGLRLKGTRRTIEVSYDAVLELGYRVMARAAAAEKAAKRKAARDAR